MNEEGKKEILIIEDNVFYSQMIKAELEAKGYIVRTVTNGELGVQEIKNNNPDLVLLDLIMPIKDGFETLEEIKKDERTKNVKVLVFSNLAQQDDIQKVVGLGATGYLIKKDFSLKDLISKIETYIN